MNRWICLVLGLAAWLSLTGSAVPEVVELGRGQVTRYAVTDADAGGDAVATGELVAGGVTGVHVEVTDGTQQVRLSLAEARSVHQLLGHMLTASGAQDTPTTQADPTTDTPGGVSDDVKDDTTGGATDPPPADRAVKKKAHLGMNLADVSYYTRAWVFTDLMLQSDAWRDDNRGYIFKSGYAPPGEYICTWGGTGSVGFSMDASANQTGANSAAVRIESGEIGIDMHKSGEVKDVSLIRLEHEMRVSPFQPEYLDRLEPFGVLRFMDWARTNNSGLRHWNDRPRKGRQTQAGDDGVAIEYMIALCNELGADPWFCMPHQADDDYIRRYAELVRDRLRPDLKVYVEYSNEVWNSQFKQHRYIEQISGGKTYSGKFFDSWAERCRNTFTIWTEVFGDQASERLVRVAAVHLQNPWVTEQMLPRLNGQFDAVSPSAYFGITNEQGKKLNAASSVDDVLDLCEQNIRRDNPDWYKAHGDQARKWSGKLGRPIRLIAYEAGQHLTAHGDEKLPYYDALIRAQNHPRMYGLYLLNMRLFEQAGGDLFVAYNDVSKPGRHGSWGHLERQNQPTGDAVKYRALVEYPSLHEK